ncbi:uncharacterized protein QC763_504167 [Podospora pseudopauciseta]|uniref:Uncharacterized protein n=1 Tax=Podospora pseudopauciseta TaxID=2093780 RepID=A0ABR0H8R5_9PEZI|nr:hypothetical protein QC763_504167 [Podospora pseudopauciseta]
MAVFRPVISSSLTQEAGGDLTRAVWTLDDDAFGLKLKMRMYIPECHIKEFYEDDERPHMVQDHGWVKPVAIVGADDGRLPRERDEKISYMIFGALTKGWDDVLVKAHVAVTGGNVQASKPEHAARDLREDDNYDD